MPPLRLTVDARVIAEDRRGIGRYARAVLRRLAERDDLELTLLAGGLLPGREKSAYARVLSSDRFAVRGRIPTNAEVVWHPANGTFFASGRPAVATIHDAVPFRYPDPDAKRRAHAQDPFMRSARTAQRVIAVSQFGSAELQKYLGIPRERIEVIYHGVEPDFSPGPATPLPPALEGRRYLLFVGDPIGEPRKNFDLLYAAYRKAWPGEDAPLLAVAGPRAPDLPGVAALGEFGDDLSASAGGPLRACYRGAFALALASFHETFGMPMLEAMACGTPVLASRAGSLPEIGGNAALYLESGDAEAWANALKQLASDDGLRQRLRDAGLAHAKTFTWERSAQLHAALFHSLRA